MRTQLQVRLLRLLERGTTLPANSFSGNTAGGSGGLLKAQARGLIVLRPCSSQMWAY